MVAIRDPAAMDIDDEKRENNAEVPHEHPLTPPIITSASFRNVRDGKVHIISHKDENQYRAGGISACGLAALNCARIFFDKALSLHQDSLILELFKPETARDILLICSQWQGAAHLEVDTDLYHLPVFERAMRRVETSYGAPTTQAFQNMLHRLLAASRPLFPAALVITRPPEILVCLKLPSSQGNVFAVFDSHPRPAYPSGAAFLISTSLEKIAFELAALLAVESQMIADPTLQWEVQLLSNCSGHIFLPRESDRHPAALQDAFLTASLQILTLRTRVTNLESERTELQSEVGTLQTEVERLHTTVIRQQRVLDDQLCGRCQDVIRSKPRKTDSGGDAKKHTWKDTLNNFISPPSEIPWKLSEAGGVPIAELDLSSQSLRPSERPRDPKAAPKNFASHRTVPQDKGKGRAVEANPSNVHRSTYEPQPSEIPGFSTDDIERARRLQRDYDLQQTTLGDSSRHRRTWGSKSTHTGLPKSSHRTNASVSRRQIEHGKPEKDAQMDDTDYVILLQHQFDAENAALEQERRALESATVSTFKCDVCLEELPEDDLAKIEPCNHPFCRACLRAYVQVQLKDQRFPVFCPSCTADSEGGQSVLNSDFIQLIGVSEKEYQQFEEFQMAAFSILLHCRLCGRSAFVDRPEYQASKILACPLPGCNHVWCKDCSQRVDVAGPQHSCDGSSELTHLMKQKGWKHCPGCTIPVQKEGGCHHMTCMSPGCNTHFCYVCGSLIIKSVKRKDIQQAVGAHYRVCRLFEVPE